MRLRLRLFPKYALLIIALVGTLLAASGAVSLYFTYREYQQHIVALQAEKAQAAANWIDRAGREQLRVSRLAMDTLGRGTDRSSEPLFRRAIAGQIFHSPVSFRKETEPYMTISRPAGAGGGVTAVDVNLKFVWDVVSRIRIGTAGLAYVVDDRGILIAHPDISLVLKKTDFSALPQVAAVGDEGHGDL